MASDSHDEHASRASGRQRLFTALYPDADVRRQLARLTRSYRHGRAVTRDNLHMTLVFLGMLDAGQAACACEIVRGVRATALSLRIDTLEVFQRARILWAGCSQVPRALWELQHDLASALAACGYRAMHEQWRPHVTLRRHWTQPPPEADFTPIVWRADRLVLFRSDNSPAGVRYTPVVTRELIV